MPKVGIELSTKSYEDFISNDFTTNATDWPDDVAINRNIYCGSFPSSSASSKKPVGQGHSARLKNMRSVQSVQFSTTNLFLFI